MHINTNIQTYTDAQTYTYTHGKQSLEHKLSNTDKYKHTRTQTTINRSAIKSAVIFSGNTDIDILRHIKKSLNMLYIYLLLDYRNKPVLRLSGNIDLDNST